MLRSSPVDRPSGTRDQSSLRSLLHNSQPTKFVFVTGGVVSSLGKGLTAVALSLTVGALVNDSGVALPATAATLLVPLLVWLVAGSPVGPVAEDGEVAEPTPGPRRDDGEAGVNVGVRGSTGRTS